VFVSCEQRSVNDPLNSLCLCQQRRSADVADCVIHVIPLHHHHQQQQQQQRQVTVSPITTVVQLPLP